jgi:hypothetical protein
MSNEPPLGCFRTIDLERRDLRAIDRRARDRRARRRGGERRRRHRRPDDLLLFAVTPERERRGEHEGDADRTQDPSRVSPPRAAAVFVALFADRLARLFDLTIDDTAALLGRIEEPEAWSAERALVAPTRRAMRSRRPDRRARRLPLTAA